MPFSRAIITIFAILISMQVICQTDAFLIFNNVVPGDAGQPVKKSDICATDTIKTNLPDVTVESYSCSVICDIDFEVRETSNIISDKLKELLCYCLKYDNQKIYFENIVLSDAGGKKYYVDSQVYRVIME